jgi:hypothetical protein
MTGRPGQVLGPVEVGVGDQPVALIRPAEQLADVGEIGRMSAPCAHPGQEHQGHGGHQDPPAAHPQASERTGCDGQECRQDEDVAVADVGA